MILVDRFASFFAFQISTSAALAFRDYVLPSSDRFLEYDFQLVRSLSSELLFSGHGLTIFKLTRGCVRFPGIVNSIPPVCTYSSGFREFLS